MSGMWAAALLSPPFATLTYLEPRGLEPAVCTPGVRFLAPVGNSWRVVLLMREQLEPVSSSGKHIQLKPLLWPLERKPLLDQDYLQMIEQLACRQMRSPGQILGALLPLPLRSSQVRFIVPRGGRQRTLTPKDIFHMDDASRRQCTEDWLEGRMRVREAAAQAVEVATVVHDPPWPVRPAASRQIAVLEYLWERGGAPRQTLLADLGEGARSALSTLVERGLVRLGPPPPPESFPDSPAAALPDSFTSEQLAALNGGDGNEGLDQALCSDKGETRLLFGVTGSGKTAVYLELVRRTLQMGRSAYLLAPEIALAQNLRRAVGSAYAGAPVLFYHGSMPPQERARIFRQAAEAEKPVLVVGARSALFLPAPNPGCVILDEEHDSSFKQEERLPYQAKEVAFFMMHQHKGLLLLGSATPDVKTFFAASQGHAPSLALTRRISDCGLPEISLVDIKGLSPTEHMLAPQTVAAIKETMANDQQAIIMLNRRGYSPLMYCLDCGRVAQCSSCEIALTYHKGRERLVCHYCGESRPYPLLCQGCGGGNYLPMGEGTQRLEETLASVLPPDVGVLRLDRDSTRRPGRMEEILQSFARKEAQVLVGTQMLSKGHHFPDVTLVVVADGDLGLNLPDYRASERTFQLLVQVAGRAGRGDKPGRVLLQTRDPHNACWQFVRSCDYHGFYENELALRRKRNYPPFVKLGMIRINYPFDWEQGAQRLNELSRMVREAGRIRGVQVLGPAPAPLKMLRGRKRYHCLLKSDDWGAIRSIFHTIFEAASDSDELRVSLDLDPVDML